MWEDQGAFKDLQRDTCTSASRVPQQSLTYQFPIQSFLDNTPAVAAPSAMHQPATMFLIDPRNEVIVCDDCVMTVCDSAR